MKQIKRVWANPEIINNLEQILDVRSPAEWIQTGVIKGSKQVFLYDNNGNLNSNFLNEVESIGINKNEPLYIICRSGVRSIAAAQILLDDGFTDVTSLDGGILHLVSKGFKLTN